MPWYRNEGKILSPLTDDDFEQGMKEGTFLEPNHKAYCVLLYYSAVRKTEGLRVTGKQFQITKDAIMFDVGERLKHSSRTSALKLPLDAPYMDCLLAVVKNCKPDERVFPFCPKTAYNVIHRAFKYPHLFRLSRITNFLLEGFTIPEIHSWTGLSVGALNYYVGLVDIARMSKSLSRRGDIK